MAPPLYHQIADDLRDKIESGELARGAQLPTELELRERYDASRNTIRDAVKRLTSLGLVVTRPGQGTFVVKKIDPFVTTLTGDPDSSTGENIAYLSNVSKARRSASVRPPRVEMQVPTDEVTLRLRLDPGTQVVSRHQERFIDGIPWSLVTSFYPFEFVISGKTPKLLVAEDMPDGVVHYLEEVLGFKQVSYRDWITARTPNSQEQTFFQVLHDSTVFEIFRTSFDQTGKPIRVTVTVFPADRNQFIVDVGTPPAPQYDQPATDDPSEEARTDP